MTKSFLKDEKQCNLIQHILYNRLVEHNLSGNESFYSLNDTEMYIILIIEFMRKNHTAIFGIGKNNV